MRIADILTPARTLVGGTGSSKKRALENIADFIHEDLPALNANALFKSLINREKLGSTGIGHGIAIPHSRLADCPTITGALVHLAEPVDFDAVDDQPVDLLFVLLVPEEACDEHLQVLGRLASLLSNASTRAALRGARTSEALFQVAIEQDEQQGEGELPARDGTA